MPAVTYPHVRSLSPVTVPSWMSTAKSTEAALMPNSSGSGSASGVKIVVARDHGRTVDVSSVRARPSAADSGIITASGTSVRPSPCLMKELHSIPGTMTPMSASPCVSIASGKIMCAAMSHSPPQITPTARPMAKICRGRGRNSLRTTKRMMT